MSATPAGPTNLPRLDTPYARPKPLARRGPGQRLRGGEAAEVRVAARRSMTVLEGRGNLDDRVGTVIQAGCHPMGHDLSGSFHFEIANSNPVEVEAQAWNIWKNATIDSFYVSMHLGRRIIEKLARIRARPSGICGRIYFHGYRHRLDTVGNSGLCASHAFDIALGQASVVQPVRILRGCYCSLADCDARLELTNGPGLIRQRRTQSGVDRGARRRWP